MSSSAIQAGTHSVATTPTPTPLQPASDAERIVYDAIRSDQVADLSGRPAAERRLDARFLETLLADERDHLVALNGALRIRGASIDGPLRLVGADGNLALLFWSCTFDAPVDLSGGHFLALRFVDCVVPALIGAGLVTRADLDLSGSRFAGVSDYECELAEVGTCAIHLSNARIGGRLVARSTSTSAFTATATVRLDGARIDGAVSFDGARLDGGSDPALDARSMTVGGNVSFGWGGERRFEACGEVALAAARITGDVSLRGARLHNPDGRALHCEDLKVESVFLMPHGETPFEAHGRLNFLSATVDGSFFMSGARLAPGPDTGLLGRGGPVIANLAQLRVSNALVMSNVGGLVPDDQPPSRSSVPVPVRGWLLLTGARLNGIVDNVETGWPAAGFLDLEDATYERLRSATGGDVVQERLRWLRLQFPDGQPTATTFRPQPYEELSRVLRQHGQAREADAVAVEKIRMRLAARADPPLARLFPRLLMLVSHHGYSSSRAVISLLGFVLVGAVLYSMAVWSGQTFIPFEMPAERVVYHLPFHLARVPAERGCPGLDVLYYALDSALPVINLGQDTYCRFAPAGPWSWLWMLLHSIYVLAGAALSAVAVLTLTGVLRRD